MTTLMQRLSENYKTVFKAVLGLSVALLMFWCINTHLTNKSLSERLETALNNIEVYQGEHVENTALKLSISELKNSNDSLVHRLDSVFENQHVKRSHINTAATLKQSLYVTDYKEVSGGDILTILVDTTYTDSILYNELTTVYYTIGRDTVSVTLDLLNTQDLFVYKQKQYKNKKNFLKRLFTLDFKKVVRTKYQIINSNGLIDTNDVRVVEIIL